MKIKGMNICIVLKEREKKAINRFIRCKSFRFLCGKQLYPNPTVFGQHTIKTAQKEKKTLLKRMIFQHSDQKRKKKSTLYFCIFCIIRTENEFNEKGLMKHSSAFLLRAIK